MIFYIFLCHFYHMHYNSDISKYIHGTSTSLHPLQLEYYLYFPSCIIIILCIIFYLVFYIYFMDKYFDGQQLPFLLDK